MANPSSLRSAVIRLLTPMVRLLLRNGVAYGAFAEIAKEVFARVAMTEFDIQGRKQTLSRVSVLTGLTRKAVKVIMEHPWEENGTAAETYNRAARVIAGWRRDPQFHNSRREIADLPFSGSLNSFSALVKKYSGDMPARAVLDELERTQSVEKTGDGLIRLLVRAYLPANDAAMKLHILGTDVPHLIATIEHNLNSDPSDAFLQRKVYYDNLPLEALAPFRSMAVEKAQALLEQMDQYLSRHDRDTPPHRKGTGRYGAGVGIYYFEEPLDHENEST